MYKGLTGKVVRYKGEYFDPDTRKWVKGLPASNEFGYDFEEVDREDYDHDDDFFELGLTRFGDYDNSSLVEQSNSRVFWDDFHDVPGVIKCYGGFGSSWILIKLSTLDRALDLDPYPDEQTEEEYTLASMAYTLREGEKDVIFNDDDLQDLTLEAEDRAWKEYIGEDYADMLLDREFPFDDDGSIKEAWDADVEALRDSMHDTISDVIKGVEVPIYDKLQRVAWEAMSEAGVYMENETQDTMLLDVKRVAEATTQRMIDEQLRPWKLEAEKLQLKLAI